MFRATALSLIFLLPLLFVSPPAAAQINLDCPVSTLFGDDQPSLVHISMTQDSTEMQVTWSTGVQTDSEVEYGLDGNLDQFASGSYSCYDYDMVFHSVTMTGLEPNSNYSYRVGNGEEWSSTYAFNTIPESAQSVKFLAFGDHGLSSEGLQTSDNILNSDADFLILSGDISYANGDQSVWDDYFQENEASMATFPWMMVPGNHENEPSYGFDAYETRLEFPSDSNTDLWHSFVRGPVHFTGFSTEHDFAVGSPQYEWLMQDLAAANASRDTIPWLVVYGHKPMYTSHGESNHDIDEQLRAELEPLFVEYGVDILIWGHDHFYERTWPVIDSTVQDRGEDGLSFTSDAAPIHIIAGTAGRGSYDYTSEQPEWVYYREKSFGMMVITANHDVMTVEYHTHEGTITDSFKIHQNKIFVEEASDGLLPGPHMLLTLLAVTLAAARGRESPDEA